jgi:hypothetical protein
MTAQDSLHLLLDYECLLFCRNWLGSHLRIDHFFSFRCPLSASLSLSYVTTDGQSASLSWNKAPIWGLRPDFYYC